MFDIAIDRLFFTYPSGVPAIRGVSLRIATGELVAIVGQNGAGKTTLVKHLNGLLKPSAGSVRVGERNTLTYSAAQMARWVGYVFQNPDDQLFKSSVRAEIAFGPGNLGWDKARVEEQTRRALKMVELETSADRHPYDLSAGERKRVALAAVLAMDTPVVIFDEPTTGQDFTGVELIGRIVKWLRSQDKTVIAISHDIDFCAEHFGRAILMSEGEVLLDGPAQSVLSQADILAQSDVEPPQMVRLAHRLELTRGPAPLTVEELIQKLKDESFLIADR
jgi:energy-coupling factor transport system ATP-binding protein